MAQYGRGKTRRIASNNIRGKPFNYYTTRREEDERLRTGKTDASTTQQRSCPIPVVVPERSEPTANRREYVFPRLSDREVASMAGFDEAENYFIEQAQRDISAALTRSYGDKAELFPVRITRRMPDFITDFFICPYCHQDVRYVPYCRPVERVEESRNKMDFDPSTVVDANPNRAELGHS